VIERAASSGTIRPEFASQRVEESAADIVASREKPADRLSVDSGRHFIQHRRRNSNFRGNCVGERAILAAASSIVFAVGVNK